MIDPQFMDDRGYVVIEGPAGVGKTSLAKKLAETFNSGLILERAEENPFLTRFYRDPQKFALPTQLSFLFQRVRRLEGLQQANLFYSHWIADFFLDRDLMFAELTLDRDEFELYRNVYDQLAPKVPAPGLVIFLQAPIALLQDRLQQRQPRPEHRIPADYLEHLINGYAQFFLRYSDAPVLMINAEKVNFIASEGDYRQLLEYLPTVQNGRHFLNPLSMAEEMGIVV